MSEVWLVGARIYDGTAAPGLDGQDLLVRDGRIAGFGRAPSGAACLDCTGLTLTPGLIDAHVHLGLSSDINRSLRHELSVAELAADMFRACSQLIDEGFTTVRDTGGIDAGLARVVATGKVRGPRILQCGPVHCQTGGHGHFAAEWEATDAWASHALPGLRHLSLLSDGPDQVRKNVRESFRRGADFVKLCVTGGVVSTHDALTDTQYTVEEIAAAVSEATARGTYVTVHAHNNEGIRNAIAAGARCVEHGSQIDEDTAVLMAQNGVAHIPTLSVAERLAADAPSTGLPAHIEARARQTRDGQRAAVLVSRAAGVRVGLGSDLIGADQARRGEELTLRAELESPHLALSSATAINAEIIGIADHTGTLEPGKQADIVAWRTDPLADPRTFADGFNAVLVMKTGSVVKDIRSL